MDLRKEIFIKTYNFMRFLKINKNVENRGLHFKNVPKIVNFKSGAEKNKSVWDLEKQALFEK